MGRHNREQGQLFYSFDLDAVVPILRYPKLARRR